MLSKVGKVSFRWFITSTAVLMLLVVDKVCILCNKDLGLKKNVWFYSLVYGISLMFCLRFRYTGFLYQISVRSVFLGTVFSFGVITALYSATEWNLFGVYICVMAFFHYSEFLAISWCNPRSLSVSSFLLNHSPQYNFAAAASWFEFAIEMYFMPGIKKYYYVSCLGLGLCIMGELVRKSAMLTGNTNFDHVVQIEKRERHRLVRHGIYSIFRHPSYVGWFYWSIGTQILLVNPICVLGYMIASWRFFHDRIMHEERTLLHFFGEEYQKYQRAVPTGMPGIRGYRRDL